MSSQLDGLRFSLAAIEAATNLNFCASAVSSSFCPTDHVARDIDALAVDLEVAVPDQLASLGARRRETGAVDGVVQAALEEAEHLLARAALPARRVLVVAVELALEDAVHATNLLLLAQANRVLAELDAALTVLAGRVRAARDRAFLGVAALTLEVELPAFTAAELAGGTNVTSHDERPLEAS